MSFRTSNPHPNEKIRIQDSHMPSQLLMSSTHPFNEDTNDEILKKISTIIVNLHEGYLAKCRNIEIYRDLSEEEQTLLLNVEKNTAIHTALAGILAIDSCVKCIDKEEAFIMGNMIRGAGAVIGQFKALERELSRVDAGWKECCAKLGDSLRYLVQQMYCIPAARGREDDQERQLALLEKDQTEISQDEYQEDYHKLLSELQRENDLLKLGIKEKQAYISMLENRQERGLPKFQKLEQKRTTHSLGYRMSTEKSSQNQSNSQHLYEQISHLKQELLEKNNIVIKMNEEFASEMEKYNSVFKRLEDENRQMKRYVDVDTAYLLEELEYEVELLREEKRKDQMIISDIQRKIEGISMARTSRINTRHGYDLHRQYQQDYNPDPLPIPHFEQRPPYENRYSKFYSPNYTSRLSPYSRGHNIKQELLYGCQPQEPFRSNNHAAMSRKLRTGDNYCRKSRNNMNHSKESKEMEPKSNPNINLFQRVMAKRI